MEDKELESLERSATTPSSSSGRREPRWTGRSREASSSPPSSPRCRQSLFLTEEERLATELEGRMSELKRSDAALQSLTAERDALARQVGELTRERAGLLDSRKALDEIHRALAEAKIRARG
jgi:hypothetical protein